MKLNELITAPPGNWKYRQLETDFWMSAVNFIDLVRKVSAHRANNKLPQVAQGFYSLADELQDAICRSLIVPDQKRICSDSKPVPAGPQPGYLFSSIIHKVTGRSALTCGICAARMKKMNDWGWWGCWRHRQEILGWLSEAAADRGHNISNAQALSLLRAGWRELADQRRQQKNAEQSHPAN